MSEECREQRPLLCEDFSEEDQFAEYPRRYRPTIYRGRAKYNVKGAAAIITRWPEHWSSVLTYWWLGLTMLAMMIFVIYNTVIAFALLPSAQTKPAPRTKPCTNGNVIAPSHLPEIYMHLFTKPNEDVDLNKYLPYIEIMADKHLEYTFNLVIVINDTNKENSVMSAEENNEVALNSLWDEDRNYRRKLNGRKNIKIKQVILSHYMDESPLKKDWRRIPHHFIEFLVKSVAIWEKGGVAVNPNILTPRSPHVLYMDKLQHILQRYKAPRETKNTDMKPKKHVSSKHKDKTKKKMNNIRDIIDALEHGEDPTNNSQDNLTEAENVINEVVSDSGRKLLSTALIVPKNGTKTDVSNFVYAHPKIRTYFKSNETENVDDKHKTDFKTQIAVENLDVNVEKLKDTSNTNNTNMSILPLFLEFLFHDKSIDVDPENINKDENVDNLTRHRKNVINSDKQKKNKTTTVSLDKTETKVNEYKPMIISAKGIISDELLKTSYEVNDIENKLENPEELTIDLRGHIIATGTSCHAFLGTIFSNAIHHTSEESLQDFIIGELSFFCKGLLSSCRGIDVILL
ncbi:uncharacterized protein LOC126368709 [Pectinophora gossypiella]|uniref:uncharacterized protein LOC126368709 n=1 Tax=Pectinophora gossypiella TaxID=13191 RepID=UPI00214E5E05|nr:uncharacterized protein LOC126368709 [Pectinophora gossypiella]XP_049868794.1 uncharacterized protein LOC126368709 [Pectinophora gossypiella]XP_049868795.1 uncharacterized protein LOC126368709 [Pectinophora gossypiella]XP_049868797.1 uncharacterized protein LOC126368709 [Pectinophora gossypiella]XP_049868798.1 uncharacterized protein LOC126368709 [Pectinophora gossypiella]